MEKLNMNKLNSLHSEDLMKLEDEVFDYYKKIKAARIFVEFLEKEE